MYVFGVQFDLFVNMNFRFTRQKNPCFWCQKVHQTMTGRLHFNLTVSLLGTHLSVRSGFEQVRFCPCWIIFWWHDWQEDDFWMKVVPQQTTSFVKSWGTFPDPATTANLVGIIKVLSWAAGFPSRHSPFISGKDLCHRTTNVQTNSFPLCAAFGGNSELRLSPWHWFWVSCFVYTLHLLHCVHQHHRQQVQIACTSS